MREQPSAKPNCLGTNPQVFDWPEFAPAAIQICEGCPVQAWCLREVDPARSYYDGVAGGHQWKEGRVCYQHSDPKNDTILSIYMAAVLHRKIRPIDMDKVRAVANGNGTYRHLTTPERIEAARLMHQQHVPDELILKHTQISENALADVKRNNKKTTTKNGNSNA